VDDVYRYALRVLDEQAILSLRNSRRGEALFLLQ
jgi:hypothetical protein